MKSVKLDLNLVGCGFCLSVIFMILKLLNLIQWSWFIVALPFLISIGIAILLLFMIFIVGLSIILKASKD